MSLWYTEFEPNKKIAMEVIAQLHSRLGIELNPTPISYEDYLAGHYPSNEGLSLELIQPLLPERFFRGRWHLFDVPSTTPGPAQGYSLFVKPSKPRLIGIPLLQARSCLISCNPAYQGKRLVDNEGLVDWSLL